MIVDRDDQSKFAMAFFTYRVKYQRSHGLPVHLIGLLRHLQVNKLRVFTMTDVHMTGANHIFESVHRLLNGCADEGPLLPILYFQLYKCWKENKKSLSDVFPCMFSVVESLWDGRSWISTGRSYTYWFWPDLQYDFAEAIHTWLHYSNGPSQCIFKLLQLAHCCLKSKWSSQLVRTISEEEMSRQSEQDNSTPILFVITRQWCFLE